MPEEKDQVQTESVIEEEKLDNVIVENEIITEEVIPVDESVIDNEYEDYEEVLDEGFEEVEEKKEQPTEKKSKKTTKENDEKKSRKSVLREARLKEAKRIKEREKREEFYSAWGSTQNAMNNHTILKGVISGVEDRSLENTANEEFESAIFISLFSEQNLKILIPFKEIYRDYPIDMRTVNTSTREGRREYIRRQKSMAEKLYGLEISFIVTHMAVDDKDGLNPLASYMIIASRAKALEVIEKSSFAPNANGVSRYKEGDFVEATVTSISHYSIAVNVAGVDTSISVSNLTYRYLNGAESIAKYYYVGQKLKVQIIDIKEEKGRYMVAVTAKPAELVQAMAKQGSIIRLKEQCCGTITSIAPSKKYNDRIIVRLYLDMYGIPAVSGSIPVMRLGVKPKSGDVLRVTVEEFYDDGMTRVSIRGFHGAMPTYIS